MGHVIGDVITNAATVEEAVGVPVGIAADVIVGLVVGVIVDAAARVVVAGVVYTARITLFKLMMVLGDIVPVHSVRDIDPDEPTNISLFRAVE